MSSNPFQYQRKNARFNLLGLQLTRATDNLDPNKYPILKNVRSYTQGTIVPRPGIGQVASGAGAGIHTIKRINDYLPSAPKTFSRFVGAGGNLLVDNAAHNGFTQIDTGYSGNPLTIVPFRPSESPDTWTYISDSNKLRKSNINGTQVYNQGILSPINPPTGINGDPVPTINPIQFDIIQISASGWTVDHTLFSSVIQDGVSDTIVAILYDTSAPGWANIVFTSSAINIWYQQNALVQMATSAETVVIDSIFLPVKTTTISSILYDSGATGLCTIQLSTHKHKALVPNVTIQIGSEYVRVLSVSWGKDNIPSLRCKTTSNHIVGETVTGVNSWRAYFSNNHSSSESYTVNPGMIFTGANPTGPATAIGTAFKAQALDLSNVNGRPIQDSDTMNLSCYIFAPQVITEIQLLLILDPVPTSNNIVDYYQLTIRPSDFIPVTTNTSSTLTAKQRKLQRKQVDQSQVPSDATQGTIRTKLQRRLARIQAAANVSDPSTSLHKRQLNRIGAITDRIAAIDASGSGKAGTTGTTTTPAPGAPQSTAAVTAAQSFTAISVKISDIARFGNDQTKNWANVTAVMVREVYNNQTTSVGSSLIHISSWWIGGTFGPTTDDPTTNTIGVPYLYRYKYRNSTTGARSGSGPSTRNGVTVTNSRVQLVATASLDIQVDKIDWERFGGSITSWKYIGTGPNSAAPFNDDFPDDTILNNPDSIENFYAPYVIQDIPRTGTCQVSGTMVMLLSGTVNLNLAKGSLIIINSIPQNVYRVLDSIHIELVDNMGALNNVSYFIPAGTIQGVALPIQWGPFGEVNVMFACGDINNPARVYYTNPNDPDSTATTNWFEPASPSETAISGFMLDAKAYVWTSERLFAIYPKLNIDPVTGVESFTYLPIETTCGRGLYSKWFQCVGNGRIYFGARDGIYYWEGGQSVCITDDISLLFPHESQSGQTVNTHVPPDYTLPQFLRLSYGNSIVRFDYKGRDAAFHSLIYSERTNCWLSQDDYTPQIQTSYVEEDQGIFTTLLGGTDGALYSLTGASDNGSAISSHFRTPGDDGGDPRTKKRIGDIILDCDLQGLNNVTATVGFDNFSTSQAPTIFPASSGRQSPQPIIDINSGLTTYAKNVALDIAWSGTAQPTFYLWDWSALLRIEDTQLRVSEWDNAGVEQAKFFQGFRLRSNTFNVLKTFKVQSDTGANGAAADQQQYTVTSNGDSVTPFSFDTPFIAHLVRILPVDANSVPWEAEVVEWSFEPEPELVSTYKTQFTSHGLRDWWHLRDGLIAHISNINWSLTLVYDDGTTSQAINNSNNTTIFNSGGAFKKDYVRFIPKKQKLVQYQVVCATLDNPTLGVRLYRRSCEIRAKAWADPGPYQTFLPFGEDHNIVGARL